MTGEVTDRTILDGVAWGLTPNMLITNKRWRRVIESDAYAERLKAFVIDEAHCVKKMLSHVYVGTFDAVIMNCIAIAGVMHFVLC